MAGSLRIQTEDQTDCCEGDREQYNCAIPAPTGTGGATILRNNGEDDIIAASYEMTQVRNPGDPYNQTMCDDSGLRGVYGESLGGY